MTGLRTRLQMLAEELDCRLESTLLASLNTGIALPKEVNLKPAQYYEQKAHHISENRKAVRAAGEVLPYVPRCILPIT
jgi:hypothetical protein